MDGDSISIRRLEARDESSWRVLWQGYLDFYRETVSEEITKATFLRLCDGSGGLVGFVAVDGKEGPIGIVHLVFHSSTWFTRPACYMEDLFVARGARGFDVARRLIETVYAEADRRGAEKVYWHTQEYNAPACSLYDTLARRVSFVVYER